jgi:DNA-binding transcriptional LysR family regulator
VQALKAGRFGQVSGGRHHHAGHHAAAAGDRAVKQSQPSRRLRVSVAGGNQRRADGAAERGQARFHRGRLFAQHDKTRLRFEALAEEPAVALVRPGHPLLQVSGLTLRDLNGWGWIVPPEGSVLRHRFDLMFLEEGPGRAGQPDRDGALLFVTKMIGWAT